MTIDRSPAAYSPRTQIRQALGDVEVLRDIERFWQDERRAQGIRIKNHRNLIGALSFHISTGRLDLDLGAPVIQQARNELLMLKFDDCLIQHNIADTRRKILALTRMDFGCHNG